jgi:hypothetical protein
MPGEIEEGVVESAASAPATGKFDREALASRISTQFDSIMAEADGTDEATETVGEETPAEVTEETAAAAKETPAADEAEKPAEEKPAGQTEAEPEAAAKPVAEKGNAPTLPAAYRRSLKAYEWTDEEIDANLKAMGPAFIQTAAKIHANRNKEVQDWAAAGHAAKHAQTQPAATQTAAAPGLKPVDAAALKKQYGDEALIDAIVGPVNTAIEQINQMFPQVQAYQKQSQAAQLETLNRQVDGFFGGKEMETYKELYGTANATLTEPQMAERTKVLELADALIVGARQQKRNLTLDDALQMAHDSVTSGAKEQVAREKIAKQLQTRQQGITLRPSGRKPSPVASPGGARKDLEKKVSSGLAKAFSGAS